MLDIGTPLPSLPLHDTTGQRVTLDDGTPGHAALVYFMRSKNCQICTRHAKDLDRRAAEYQGKGVQVYIAIPEGLDDAVGWKAKHEITVPVVVATVGSAYDTVGLTRKVFGSIQQSGTILVDSNGTIHYALSATMPTGGYDSQAVTNAVDTFSRGH
ncbi:MAG TPA: redoxin domain-containing protein [Actinocrinis sp.]|nr:redoxin domain-containing protein [Actinocrinis sp.]